VNASIQQPRAYSCRSLLRAVVSIVLAAAAVSGVAGAAPIENENENENNPTEYEVKAAWIFKFVKYVEWPADRFEERRSPIVIGVLGRDPFGKILDKTFAGKRHDQRPFVILRSKKVEELRRCHILFVPGSEKGRVKEIVASLKGRSVLLIGEWEGFASRGGIVNFYLKDKRVRFEINPEAAVREKLKISSKLLRVARIVKEGGK